MKPRGGRDTTASPPGDGDPGCTLEVEVQPRASRTEVVGWREGRLRVRLAAPPVEGAANEALVALLADHLDLPGRRITLVSGHTGRRKRLRIEGLDRAAVEARLGS